MDPNRFWRATEKCVGPLLFILYTSEMFQLVEKRLYAYSDDSALQAVVRKPAVAACFNRDWARIQARIHWCMVLNPNKTKALVVSRSRDYEPYPWDLVLSGVQFVLAQPRHSWCEVLQQTHLRRSCGFYCLPWISNNWYFEVGEACLCGYLCCFVVTMHLFSQSLSIVLWCRSLLMSVIFCFSSARCIRWPGFALIKLSCRYMINVMLLQLCMLYKVNSNSSHCLLSGLPSASVRVRQIRAAAAVHPLEFEVSRCITSQFARCFLPARTSVWNDLPYTVFYTVT